ncbi:hypothetical protein Nepgr_023374 [Nepenthes gracilis]|uniref:Uncharacterized protein n=1 Tax=Nepenthes gracilis TaxID=150966 RepID=A0AAD3T2F3_NEPGR|nr:hypothetical protein Nepgr_023374 [Nepenthes gracilis]
MVSRVEEGAKGRQKGIAEGKETCRSHLQEQQKQKSEIMRLKKGKAGKFKRSSSVLEDDGASSAILLLACIACAPSYTFL